MKRQYFLNIFLGLIACLPLQAQQAGGRWSLYACGALGTYNGISSPLYEGTPTLSPEVAAGVTWQCVPSLRLSVEGGYILLREHNDKITSTVLTDPNFMLGGYQTTLTTQADCLQNKNRQHIATGQLTAEYALSALWLRGRTSPFNIYVGTGVGLLMSKSSNTRTTAYNAEAIAEGDTYSNIYQHAYVKSEKQKDNYTAPYVPVSLTAELSVLPNVTIGARGQLKCLFASADLAPKTIYNAGLLLRIKW